MEDLTPKQQTRLDELKTVARRIRTTDAMLLTVPKFKLKQKRFKDLIAHLTIVRTNNSTRFDKLMKEINR